MWSRFFVSRSFLSFARSPFCTMAAASEFKAVTEGSPDTFEYRVFLEKDGKRVSPFHDVPLVANAEKGTFNMVRGPFSPPQLRTSTIWKKKISLLVTKLTFYFDLGCGDPPQHSCQVGNWNKG